MAPPNPLGDQILGKEAIFGDFGALFGGQKSTKNREKNTWKKQLIFGVACGVIGGYLGGYFSLIFHIFSGPESKRTTNRPRGDSYSKNHTILKVRAPKKHLKINQKPFQS